MSRIGNFIKTRPVIATLLGGAVLLAGVGAVSAQYGGGMGGPGGWHRGGGMGGHGWGRQARMERMCGMETARWAPVARAWIKADLALTTAQAAEFDKLADIVAPAVEQIKGEVCGNFGPSAPKVTAPERLEKAASATRKAADAMDKAIAPAKAFYATLDEKQKARVEEMSQRRRDRMGHGDMRGDGQGDGRGWRRGPGGYGGPQGGPGMPPFGQGQGTQQ